MALAQTEYLGAVVDHADGWNGAVITMHLCRQPDGGLVAVYPHGWHPILPEQVEHYRRQGEVSRGRC
jgi:hypothetical protein